LPSAEVGPQGPVCGEEFCLTRRRSRDLSHAMPNDCFLIFLAADDSLVPGEEDGTDGLIATASDSSKQRSQEPCRAT
jgi:hypothetical protein